VADQTLHACAQDAGGNQMQHRLLAVDHQCVASIVATLEAGHTGHLIGQQINDLALAFVTPLGAQNYDVLAHGLQSLFLIQNEREWSCQRWSANTSSRSQRSSAGSLSAPGSACTTRSDRKSVV